MTSSLTEAHMRKRLATNETPTAALGPRRLATDVFSCITATDAAASSAARGRLDATLSLLSLMRDRGVATAARCEEELAYYAAVVARESEDAAAAAADVATLTAALAAARERAAHRAGYTVVARKINAHPTREALCAALAEHEAELAAATRERAAGDTRVAAKRAEAAYAVGALEDFVRGFEQDAAEEVTRVRAAASAAEAAAASLRREAVAAAAAAAGGGGGEGAEEAVGGRGAREEEGGVDVVAEGGVGGEEGEGGDETPPPPSAGGAGGDARDAMDAGGDGGGGGAGGTNPDTGEGEGGVAPDDGDMEEA